MTREELQAALDEERGAVQTLLDLLTTEILCRKNCFDRAYCNAVMATRTHCARYIAARDLTRTAAYVTDNDAAAAGRPQTNLTAAIAENTQPAAATHETDCPACKRLVQLLSDRCPPEMNGCNQRPRITCNQCWNNYRKEATNAADNLPEL